MIQVSRLALALLLGLVGVSFSQEQEEEARKSQQESELSKLKQGNEGGGLSEVKINSKKEADTDGFCRNEFAGTGCFIGLEVGYSANVKNSIAISQIPQIPQISQISNSGGSQQTSSVPVNLTFGYQWYFARKVGLQFKGYAGYANYNSKGENKVPTVTTNNGNVPIEVSSSAIHYGAEANFLYDLFQGESVTFGINAGVGYQFGTFIGQKATVSGPETQQATKLFGKPVVDFSNYTASSFTYNVGLYLALSRHHHFGFNWRVTPGYSASNSGGDMTKMVSLNGVGVPGVGVPGVGVPVKYKSAPVSSFLFSYSYLF